MAEATVAKENEGSNKQDTLDCAVCLQPCVHPAQLPCGHIFCYLCVKGFQNRKCAMCRQDIPRDFIEQPHLLKAPQPGDPSECFDGGYQWFYEGRNGWWQYDERASKELEASYKKGSKTVELLIAGFLYVIDFENMLQSRKSDPSRKRQIKRDLTTINIKGVAGIRTQPINPRVTEADDEIQIVESDDIVDYPSNGLPNTPSNTPQSPGESLRLTQRDFDALRQGTTTVEQLERDLLRRLDLNICSILNSPDEE